MKNTAYTFNPKSDNSEILIICHLRLVQRKEALLFPGGKKKASPMKQADLQDMFKKASQGVCTCTIVVSPDLVSYSITYFSYEDSRKHRREP
jgi:hypothetical protein